MLLAFIFLVVLFMGGLLYLHPPIKSTSWLHNTPSTTTTTSSSLTSSSSTSNEAQPIVDKAELRRLFATFDKDGDGFITAQEMDESLRRMGLAGGDLVHESADANADGLVDFEEFEKSMEAVLLHGGGEELKEAFNVFDRDGDGLITVEELGLVLSSLGVKGGGGGVVGRRECGDMIRRVDLDGDGMVNFEEFKRMMGGRFLGKYDPVSADSYQVSVE
ncbi:putative calcium-binding protein CML17 [Acorus calamus]|uniref:Calcium-binding protein CML17 n=1 Tax=Acorus calamus TaxID=4465 RepID=A0AAV9CUG2_ACOCL|nr:putative calcium-binding protein CML17 [Acorus calamus]